MIKCLKKLRHNSLAIWLTGVVLFSVGLFVAYDVEVVYSVVLHICCDEGLIVSKRDHLVNLPAEVYHNLGVWGVIHSRNRILAIVSSEGYVEAYFKSNETLCIEKALGEMPQTIIMSRRACFLLLTFCSIGTLIGTLQIFRMRRVRSAGLD